VGEVLRPLVELRHGEVFTADKDGAAVITGAHSHSDILRYVVADLGADEVASLVSEMRSPLAD
jgi:hypothetical protein